MEIAERTILRAILKRSHIVDVLIEFEGYCLDRADEIRESSESEVDENLLMEYKALANSLGQLSGYANF